MLIAYRLVEVWPQRIDVKVEVEVEVKLSEF
jgi:hypothetical protein